MTPVRQLLILLILFASQQAAAYQDLVLVEVAHARLKSQNGQSFEGPVNLTHRWDMTFPGQQGEALYTINLPAATEAGTYAIFLYRAGNQLEVSVNGLLIRRFGQLGDPGQDWAKGPLLFDVPPAILHADRHNTRVIHATLQPLRSGGRSHVLFGPEAALRPLFNFNYAARKTGYVVIAATSAVVGLFALFLAMRQWEPVFAYASFAAFMWMLRAADRALVEAPLPWKVWSLMSNEAYFLCCTFMLLFMQHLLRIQNRAMVRWNYGLTVVGMLLIAVAYLAKVPALWDATLVLLSSWGMVSLAFFSYRALQDRTVQGRVLAALCALVLFSAMADMVLIGMRSKLIVEIVGGGFSLTPYTISLLLMGLLWVVADRYVQSANEIRIVNESVERKLDERERDLAQAFEVQRRQHSETLLMEERQRIMRDMHDGLGARLVSLLNLVKRGGTPAVTLESQVLSALDELRLTIDSLQPNEGDLATVLGTLRYRMAPTFDAAGIDLIWQVEALPAISWLTPNAVLHIQHILLEIFTNAIKHSRAARITVWASHARLERLIRIRVSDNGAAPASPRESKGHGLSNMRARAQAVGSELDWRQDGDGTTVELRLPDGSTSPVPGPD